ncbi:hypothetical protein BDN70DRAFT_817344 [Pholiota conissans]|uniref:DUF6534 domain-containing protein n=1 Tax=Pholiota conissans TaxID=109636 RepID=A0A9P5YP60_9AGAR|nr:hypothetical protein BDN70DRAFT_817344 [Pholiota conissans]
MRIQFIVVVTNWALFGVLSIQVYIHSQAFPNDRPILKTLVYGVYLMEMAQTILLTQTGWAMLVQGFGNVEAVDEIGTTFISVPLIGGLVGLLVQLFYAWRIAIISHKKIIPAIIFFVRCQSLLSTECTNLNDFYRSLLPPLQIWGGATSFCDVVIAVCMCYYLRKNKGIVSKTQALVSRLVKMTIETGVLTGQFPSMTRTLPSVSIVSLIFYYSAGLRNFSYFVVPLSMQGKLYSTTMLAVLNSRMVTRMATESTAWRDNELPFTTLPPLRNVETLRLNLSPMARLPISNNSPKDSNGTVINIRKVSHFFTPKNTI